MKHNGAEWMKAWKANKATADSKEDMNPNCGTKKDCAEDKMTAKKVKKVKK